MFNSETLLNCCVAQISRQSWCDNCARNCGVDFFAMSLDFGVGVAVFFCGCCMCLNFAYFYGLGVFVSVDFVTRRSGCFVSLSLYIYIYITAKRKATAKSTMLFLEVQLHTISHHQKPTSESMTYSTTSCSVCGLG